MLKPTMKDSISHSNKTIGFRLTGSIVTEEQQIDPIQTYEIEIFPDEHPVAFITNIKKGETKSIVVQLPIELKQITYEKASIFFLQNELRLIVTAQGYEKIGNRKLLVEFGQFPHSGNINILVKGESKNQNYRINIDPYDIRLSSSEIQDINTKNYKKAHLELGEMKGLDEKIIKKILFKLNPNNFHVEMSSKTLFISLGPSLKQFIFKPKRTPHTQPSMPNNLANDETFFECLKELETTPIDVSNDNLGKNESIQQLAQDEWEHFGSSNTFISSLKDKFLLREEILEEIIEILHRFQTLNFLKEIKRSRGENFDYLRNLIATLDIAPYTKILTIIINQIDAQETRFLLIYRQLKAMLGILNIVVAKEAEDRYNIYREAYDRIISFANNGQVLNKSLMTDYIAQTCKLSFSFVSESQNLLYSKEMLNLFTEESIETNETKGFFSKIMTKFKSWRSDQDKWFIDLLTTRKMLLEPSSDAFFNFAETIEKNFDLQNSYFILGFTEILVEITYFPQFTKVNEKIKVKAHELLNIIYLNVEKIESVEHQNELKTFIESYLSRGIPSTF